MVDEQQLQALIEKHGLSHLCDRILADARPAVRIAARRLADEADADPSPLGTSRFGGYPDLPPELEWPVGHEHELVFLAQLRLTEIPTLPGREQLPSRGMLWFFYDLVEGGWGFDPKDRQGFCVLFSEQEDGVVRRRHGEKAARALREKLGAYAPFCPSSLKFEQHLTVPGEETSYVEPSDPHFDAYYEFLAELYEQPMHWLLGHPSEVQGDMKLECQLVANGLYCGDESGYNDPRAEALKQGASDWRLLLQIDTDEEGPGWMWGDAGMLYFWIRAQDLVDRDFSRAWCVLQCY